jgi:dodecin
MASNSVYKVIDIVGVSADSWTAMATASKSLRDLRVAEVTKLDLTVEDGKVARFRTRLSVSFRYQDGED